MYKPLVKFLGASIFRIAFRLKIYGKDNIPEAGFIFAPNHVSLLDPIAVGSIIPIRINFLARNTLFRNPFFGWLISACGSIPLKRGTADIGAIKEAIRRVRRGGALVVFPEGTRSSTKNFLAPKEGIGFLATKLDVPVVPVFVKGTAEALPRGAKKVHFNKVFIYIGKAMRFDSSMEYSAIAEKVMEGIAALAPKDQNS